MKPFFCFDVTKDKSNPNMNGVQFATAKVSAAQAKLFEEAIADVEQIEKKVRPWQWLRFIGGFFLVLALMIFSTFLEPETPFAEIYAARPGMFWASVGCIVLWVGLAVLDYFIAKKFRESSETKQVISSTQEAMDRCYAELGVPADAENVDILMFRYAVKDGKIKPQSGLNPSAYYPCDCKVFVLDDCLCFSGVDQRFDIPLRMLTRIETIEKGISIPTWNKKIPIKQPPYKQYNLRLDNNGFVHMKSYHILHFDYYGEDWGIYLPCYDLPLIQKLTALDVNE